MIINFTKTKIHTANDLIDSCTYFFIDFTQKGYEELLVYLHEDFCCGVYFLLEFPFSKSCKCPLDYFNSNCDEEITNSLSCFASNNKTYSHKDFTQIKINQINETQEWSLLTCSTDLNAINYFAKNGFDPLFYPCILTGMNKLQTKSLQINGTLEEKAMWLHKQYGLGVDVILKHLNLSNENNPLIPPSCIIKNITKEMVCQYLELEVPLCHPNMYPFLKLEKTHMIVDGKIQHIETVDLFMEIWVKIKLQSIVPEIEKEKNDYEKQEFIYQFLLLITDHIQLVWFVWATKDERHKWISDNITSRAIETIEELKLVDIATIAATVLRHEGIKTKEKRDYRWFTVKDYYINKLKQ